MMGDAILDPHHKVTLLLKSIIVDNKSKWSDIPLQN